MYYPHQSKFILIDNNWKKKKQKIQILKWPQAALLFTNSASKNNLNFLSAKQKEEKIKKKNILTIYIVNDASNVKTVSKYYILKAVLCLSTKLFKRRLNLKTFFQMRAISIKIFTWSLIFFYGHRRLVFFF